MKLINVRRSSLGEDSHRHNKALLSLLGEARQSIGVPDGSVKVAIWNGQYAPERTLTRVECARWKQIPETSSGMTEV